MKRLSLERKVLRVIERLVSDELAEDCEYTLLMGRKFSQAEARSMADKITTIYTVAHSAIKDHSCFDVHNDWRAATLKLYSALEEVKCNKTV